MSRFKMNSSATKKAVKQATESAGGMKRFKWDDNRLSGEFLILAPITEEMGAVFTSKNHEYWVNGRPTMKSGTPSYTSQNGGEATGEEDKIVSLGWRLRDKFINSKNEKKKNFWQKFMLNTQHHILVLDLKNIEAGPLVWSMPTAVADVVLEEIKDTLENDGDLTSICDFDEGQRLYVKANGEKGKKRRYKVVKFKAAVNLLEDGTLTEDDLEEIAEKMYDLSKIQLKYNAETFEKYYEYLQGVADKIGVTFEAKEEDSEDEEYESDDEYEDEEGEEDLGVDEDELNLDEEEDDEDDEEELELEEEEEAEAVDTPKKKKKKKVTSSEAARVTKKSATQGTKKAAKKARRRR